MNIFHIVNITVYVGFESICGFKATFKDIGICIQCVTESTAISKHAKPKGY